MRGGNDVKQSHQLLCIGLFIATIALGLYLLNRHYKVFERFTDQPTQQVKFTKVLLFYAEWCGHCQSLKPKWNEAKAKFPKTVEVKECNADEEADKPDFEKHGVNSFPSIKLVKADGTVVDYSGDRSANDIVGFVESNSS